jgi:hypothetical protein
MIMKINPFRPGSPVSPGMFVGRVSELENLESAILQTRASQPSHFMVTGERGIGKTSMFLYLRFIATGDIPIEKQHLNFLVIDSDITLSTTQKGLIERVGLNLKNELGKTEKTRTFISNAWNFVNRIEICDSRIKGKEIVNEELLLDEFSFSLADITKRVCSTSSAQNLFGTKYDGILLLIDEADNSSPSLHIGSFFKLLTERLQKLNCNNLMIGLAGLNNLRDVLHHSHPSSLRIFNEIQLGRLTSDEVSRVIDICLEKANEQNDEKTNINDEGREALIALSEGYPHFIQQFGYSAFAVDSDGMINPEDVYSGAFGSRGALERIGDGYYRDSFYNKIQKDSYRQVLRIMAKNLDSWTTRQEIKSEFKGKDSTLNNAIRALRERHIIISKEGVKGIYRLQHKGFALWINLCTRDPMSTNGNGKEEQ